MLCGAGSRRQNAGRPAVVEVLTKEEKNVPQLLVILERLHAAGPRCRTLADQEPGDIGGET